MNKYDPVKPGEIVSPYMDRLYRMECCDCGLVHKLRFQVIRETARRGPEWQGVPASKSYKVVFQSWRDNRATAARRKKRGKRGISLERE
jgi:hypothetical protein